MRRLRALLPFAGRRSHADCGDVRPAPIGSGAGRVDRRRLLSLISFAPVAAPALARAALAAEPLSKRIVGTAIANDWPMVVGDWRPTVGSPAFNSPMAVLRSRIALLEKYEHAEVTRDAIKREIDAMLAPPAEGFPEMSDVDLTALSSAPFVDDAGSGP